MIKNRPATAAPVPGHWRAWAWLVGALHKPSHPAYGWVNGAIWGLIVVSIALIGVELLLLDTPYMGALEQVDRVILWLFVAEITLRVATYRPAELDLYGDGWLGSARAQVVGRLRYCLEPMTLIDLITVLAVYPPLRALRAARLLRLLRTGRVFRYANPFAGLLQAFRDNSPLY